MLRPPRRLLALATATCCVLSVGACADDPESAKGQSQIVIDTSFDLKTADPARQFEPTGGIVDKAVYQTLITFVGEDVTKPVPGLADFQLSEDSKVLTLKMKSGQVFSDGSPVTVDDAVFSLQRVQGIKGNPSFLLDGVAIAKVDDSTFTMTSAKANADLPFILTNTALAVVNAKAVQANGGSATADDKAEQFMNTVGAGSGPYVLKQFDVKSQVTLELNPKWKGAKPTYEKVILRNVTDETQKVNLQAGSSQIALDLSPDQVKDLDKAKVKVHSGPSAYVVFLLMNQSPAVNKWTSNPDFMQAVKLGVDYDKLVALAGAGAAQPGGIIPSLFVGSLQKESGLKRDVAAAKAALAKSGYTDQTVQLGYANDLTVQGVSLQSIAAAVQAQLREVGINVALAPGPVASELDAYRGAKESMGLWYWGPDYPAPSDYLAFAPGGVVGKRASWAQGAAPAIDDLTTKAAAAGPTQRGASYGEWQKALNAYGPFVPLLQPAQNVASSNKLSELGLNIVWKIDVAAIK